MAYDQPSGGTGAIVRINRTLCATCQSKGYSNDDACTGILEILDHGRRYNPRKCRHELELIEAGIPEWVHERARTRAARAGGIVDGATRENAVPTVAEYLPDAMAGMVQVGNEWRIVAPAPVESAPVEIAPTIEAVGITENQSRVMAFVAGGEEKFDGEGNRI